MNLFPYIPVSVPEIASKNIPAGRFLTASLLFADVSGFTAMSEKLAASGKEGAEELTAILNNYFTHMISIVSSLDGDIIVFGGDAMLIYFTNAANAFECAVRMQEDMKLFGSISTSAGIQTLRMSIGISSGRAFLAALGDKTSAGYGMFGSCVNRVGAVEAIANAGEICCDRFTLKKLNLRSISNEVSKGIFRLESKPAINIDSTKSRYAHPSFDPSPFINPGLRERLAGGFDTGEHRKVTVMFMNFRGVNKVLKTNRTSILTELNSFFCACRDIISGYGGFLCKIDLDKKGYKMMVAFGAPLSHEDDCERAFHTALEISRLKTPFSLRIGINTGFVFAGFVGAPSRKEYTVMGDAVNIAARLMASAPEGEIFVHDDPGGFNLTELPPVRVKGKSEPITLSRLESEKQASLDQTNNFATFINRKKEIDILRERLRSAFIRKGNALSINGDAGSGKTRILQEAVLLFEKEGCRTLTAQCLSHKTNERYFSIRQLFPSLSAGKEETVSFLKSIDPGLEDWLPLTGDFTGMTVEDTPLTAQLDTASRQRILFDILLQALIKSASEKPVAVVIDSAQWLDGLSKLALDHIIKNIGTERILVLLSGRGTTLSDIDQLELSGLSRDGSLALASSFLGGKALSQEASDILYNKSGGNPLFLLETLKALLEEGWIAYDEHLNEYELDLEYSIADTPDTLRGIIMARVDRLSEKERRMLHMASVIGFSFHEDILFRVLGSSDRDVIQGIIEREFLAREADTDIRFTQSILQETIYESIAFSEKRKLHKQIGSEIEKMYSDDLTPHLSDLAGHFYNSDTPSKALLYLEKTAEQAAKTSDVYLAIDCHKKILTIESSDTEQRASSCLSLGNIYGRLGDFNKSLDYYSEGGGYEIARLEPQFLYRKGELLRSKGRLPEAEELFRKIPEGERYADAMASLGLLNAMKGGFGEAKDLLEKAMVIFNQNEQQRGMAYCLINLSEINRRQGMTAAAVENLNRALAVFVNENDISGECNVQRSLGAVYDDRGEYGPAMEHYSRSLELSEKIRNPAVTTTILTNLGLVYIETGMHDEAKKSFLKALRLSEKLRALNSKALVLLNLARPEFEEGEVGLSLSRLKEAMKLTEETGNLLYRVFVHIRAVEILLEIGDLITVHKHLNEMKDIIEKNNIRQCGTYYLLFSGTASLLSFEYERAEDELTKALESAEKLSQKPESARAMLALSELCREKGRSTETDEHFHKASEIISGIQSAPLILECALNKFLSGNPEDEALLEETHNIHIKCRYFAGKAERLKREGKTTKSSEYARKALNAVMSVATTIEDSALQRIYLEDSRREKLKLLV